MVQVSNPPRTPRQAARRRDALDGLLDPALFAALADPTRARLLACIARCRRACSVGEIAECCAVDLSVVSRHLKVLAQAGALVPEREGRIVRYRLRASELQSRMAALADALGSCAPDSRSGGEGCCDGCC
jgi:ArsR family transcriptional regulator